MVTDIDIMINRKDLRRACRILGTLNFLPSISQLEKYIDFLEGQSFHRFDNEYLCLTDEGGVTIDLHWSLGAEPPLEMRASSILSRAEGVKLYGTWISVPSSLDSIMLISHHAMRNNFAPFATVKDLCDMSAWGTLQGTRWRIEEAITKARKSDLSIPCLALWQILVHLNPESPIKEAAKRFAAAASDQERKDVDRLEDSFMLQLEESALNNDFLNILINPSTVNPSTIKQYLVNRIRSTIYRSVDLKMRGEPPQPIPSRAIRVRKIFDEIFRLDSKRLAAYRALARAKNHYADHPLK
jgi:hypothetical protein